MVDYKNNKINNIPDLKVGDEKLLNKFGFKITSFTGLKDWAFEFIFRKR